MGTGTGIGDLQNSIDTLSPSLAESRRVKSVGRLHPEATSDSLFAGSSVNEGFLYKHQERVRATNRVTYLTLAFVVLASLGLSSQVQASGPTPEPRPTPTPRLRPTPHPRPTPLSCYPTPAEGCVPLTPGDLNTSVGGTALALSNANSTYNFNNSKFDGWWRNTMIGSMSGFHAGGPSSALQDQYIYIDASVFPVRIYTTYGTDTFPRLTPDAFDSRPVPLPCVPGVPAANSYFYKEPNELVNGYNPPFEGSFYPLLSLINGDTLELIDDHTISAFKYYNYHYSGQTSLTGLAIFKKMENPPIDTSGLDWNDPVNLFRYYGSANTFANLSTSQRTGAQNYVGPAIASNITSQFLNGTFSKTTPLRKIRITNTAYYPTIGIPKDTWTTIYTGNPENDEGIFSYVTPGSNVTIQGATGALSILNGTYRNGIG